MTTHERLDYQDLDVKTSIACFVRPEVRENAVQMFEEAFARGRDFINTYVIYPTRSFDEKSIDELADLCVEKFSQLNNPFYPYFFVLLDERTNNDGSGLIVQRDPDYPGGWELRMTPASMATFLACASIGHKTIESVIENEGYDDPEVKDTYVDDVPFDHTEELSQVNARVPIQDFQRSENADEAFTTLSLPRGKAQAYGLPAVDVELQWFGEPRRNVLLLSGIDRDTSDARVVVGAKETTRRKQ